MPSGSGDFFRAARASRRISGTVGGGGGSANRCEGEMSSVACRLHGEFRCSMRWILRVGTGKVEGAGGGQEGVFDSAIKKF